MTFISQRTKTEDKNAYSGAGKKHESSAVRWNAEHGGTTRPTLLREAHLTIMRMPRLVTSKQTVSFSAKTRQE